MDNGKLVVVKKMDDLGRIHIPKEIRKQVIPKEKNMWFEGATFEVFVKDGYIVSKHIKQEVE